MTPTPLGISLFFSVLNHRASSAARSSSELNQPLSATSRTSAAALPCLTSLPSQTPLSTSRSASHLTFTTDSLPELSQTQSDTPTSTSTALSFDRFYEFLARSLSKDDCKILSSLIEKYYDPIYLRSIACLIEKQPAKDWLEEHPVDKAALFFLALRDPRTDAERIRSALPLNWGLIKWLIDNNKKEALFYLLTEGCQEASSLFADHCADGHLSELLQSECFKELFRQSKELLAPFISKVFQSTLTTLISIELLNQQLEDQNLLSTTTPPRPRRGGHLSKRTAIQKLSEPTAKRNIADRSP